MRSPALAIAWEIRQRHRWGLFAVAGYVIVLGTMKLLVLAPGDSVNLDALEGPPEIPERFAATVVVPLTSAFLYLVAVFSFGLSGDLAARRSMYPARAFTLPIATAELAGWPMLYGSAAMAVLWMATAVFGLRPSGVDVPLLWPALLAAVFLAWTQVLMWMPWGFPGIRVIVAVLALVAVDTAVILAIHYRASEPAMVALLAPQLPLAYLAARVAVARARRGEVPDWRGIVQRVGPRAAVPPRRRAPFASAAHAHLWLEWRRSGWSLPVWVGILLPFELSLLFVADDTTPAIVLFTLLGVLVTPPLMAAFAAARISTADPDGREQYGVTPFLATRPLSTAALIGTQLRMALWSTVAAWLLVIVAAPLALALSGNWLAVTERIGRLSAVVGTPRVVLVLGLLFCGAVASTWKQLVQTLCIGLTGRRWVVRTNTIVALTILILIVPFVEWVLDDREVFRAIWNGLPLILAMLVGLKMSAAAWVAVQLYRSTLISDRGLIAGAAGWLATVLLLYGLLAWFFSTPIFPRYLVALVAILAVPLTRVSAAPLALAWNRHR